MNMLNEVSDENIIDVLELDNLSSIEDFFQHFEVKFDASIIRHQRIHLLRLFQNQLSSLPVPLSGLDYKSALRKAYCLLQSDYKLALNKPACGDCVKCD